MLTHYIRHKGNIADRFETPVESLVYQAIPVDRLVVEAEVQNTVPGIAKKEGDAVPNQKSVRLALQALVERRFVRELIGARLKNALDL